MKSRIFLPTLLAVFLPTIACANSMAPIFPVLSTWGWFAMPLIVLLEGAFYARSAVRNPLRLSLYSNLWSGLIGLLPAALTFPIMLGPAIDADFASILIGAGVTISCTTFHWWFSSRLEHAFAKRHKLWKDEPILLPVFFKANGLSYGLISLLLLVGLIKQLLDYSAKT